MVIILLGPTGVGKTALSLLLAKRLATEIISADSMQVYRHMDIGTAKPAPEERTEIPHHMIDVAEPWEHYSTGRYVAAVRPIIDRLLERGKIPLIVGGTGLYIKAMTRGIFTGPSADWTLREHLLALERQARGTLYESLKTLDPESAAKIMPTDSRRLIRALEVCLTSNKPMSAMQRALTHPFPYAFVKIGVTRQRKELYHRIEQRVDWMREAGLVEEVRKVLALIGAHGAASGCLPSKAEPLTREQWIDSIVRATPSMQAIGYKEIALYLTGRIGAEEAFSLVKRASKRYAKRQFTWFKQEEDVQWFDISGTDDPHAALEKMEPLLSRAIDAGMG